MKRLLAAVAGLALAGTAAADIGPPKGSKQIAVESVITTEKEYPDYAFFTVTGTRAFARVAAVKLDPKTPLTITGGGRGAFSQRYFLVAVPKVAGKGYAGEKEFHAAIAGGKVEGLLRSKVGFDSAITVKDTDPRKTATQEYKLEKIDPKDGVVVTRVEPGAKKDEKGPAPEEEEGVAAFTPRGGVWVAGLAAAAAAVLTGLWLTGRRRRELGG